MGFLEIGRITVGPLQPVSLNTPTGAVPVTLLAFDSTQSEVNVVGQVCSYQ